MFISLTGRDTRKHVALTKDLIVFSFKRMFDTLVVEFSVFNCNYGSLGICLIL